MLVKHYPKIIDSLNFGVAFARDSDIINLMKKHYRMYSYIYMCVEDNIAILQDIADTKRDYYNELYKTMLYEYNPLENYNMTEFEETADDRQTTSNTNTTNVLTPNNWKTKNKNTGYDTETETETSETETTGTYTTTDNGAYNGTVNTDINRTLKRFGNIGVQTSMDMIQKQRDITLNIIEMYLNEFSNCFGIEL